MFVEAEFTGSCEVFGEGAFVLEILVVPDGCGYEMRLWFSGMVLEEIDPQRDLPYCCNFVLSFSKSCADPRCRPSICVFISVSSISRFTMLSRCKASKRLRYCCQN